MKFNLTSFLIATVSSVCVFAGGMSGGGGNVINPTPPKHVSSPDRVDNMIEKAFHQLPGFLKLQEQRMKNGEMDPSAASIYASIFEGAPNIFQAMKNRKLHIEEDKNCYNSFGVPYDASIIAPEPNSVCISAFSISKKVAIDEISAQVSALLVHEYSEVKGLNDEQAITIQELVLSDIKNFF